MHILVLPHSNSEAIQALARTIASELHCRTIPFERRPEAAMYDLIVVGTSGLSLLDPRLPLYLASGELRGKSVAFFDDAPPCLTDGFRQCLSLMAWLGGATVYPANCNLFSWIDGDARHQAEKARKWARHLADDFPAPEYPLRVTIERAGTA